MNSGEQRLVLAFYRCAEDPEFSVLDYPLPDHAKEMRIPIDQFAGLRECEFPNRGAKVPGWVYKTQHHISMVENVIPIGKARDPAIGGPVGIVGVFDANNSRQLTEMISGCHAAKCYFEKNIMNR